MKKSFEKKQTENMQLYKKARDIHSEKFVGVKWDWATNKREAKGFFT